MRRAVGQHARSNFLASNRVSEIFPVVRTSKSCESRTDVLRPPTHELLFGTKKQHKTLKTLRAKGNIAMATPIVMDSHLYDAALPADVLESAYDDFQGELIWSEMFHKGGAVPRLVCIQGEVDETTGVQPIYRHPADEQPSLQHWTPTVRKLRDIVSAKINQPLNHALIQLYRSGDDYISEHADKTIDVARGSMIVNLSLGASRQIVLRPKKGGAKAAKSGKTTADGSPIPRPATRLDLTHGSLFVLGWETNRAMTHEVRRDKRPDSIKSKEELAFDGCRISLTFRNVATFVRPDGGLFGQGAPSSTTAAAAAAAATTTTTTTKTSAAEEEEELIGAFSTENRYPDFDWDAVYGKEFAAIKDGQ